jgi:hypothetical protein
MAPSHQDLVHAVGVDKGNRPRRPHYMTGMKAEARVCSKSSADWSCRPWAM